MAVAASVGRRAALAAGAALAWLAVWLAAAAGSAGAVERALVGSFNQPVYVGAPAGDERRLFVVQKGGVIRLLVDGIKRERPFLRIPGGVAANGERGLLSMAFHPGYEQNRRFYVFYNRPSDGDVVIDEFLRSPASPNRANPDSQRHVIRVEHSAHSNHNGGQLQFGADRNLYISLGDGGGQPDPDDLAQNKFRRLGKILRIDPVAPGAPYASPPDNPFVGRPGADEIFAYGLRNPFRFSFDSVTGDIAIADVGWQTVEEIDFLAARVATSAPRPGVNFGWDCFEGSMLTAEGRDDPSCLRGPSPHKPPILEHLHGQGFRSIIGGYVAHSPTLPSQEGRYVYGDFDDGDPLRSAILNPGEATDDRSIGVSVPSLVSFGEDGTGQLYAVSIAGPVYRLED